MVAKSKYEANPSILEWSSVAHGFVMFNLNSQTGVITPSPLTKGGASDPAGPATAYAGMLNDETIDNDPNRTEHTVSFKIGLGVACHGTIQLQVNSPFISYGKQHEYGAGETRWQLIVMTAKRGNN